MGREKLLRLLVLPLLAVATCAGAVPPLMPPTNHCMRDASFAAFRTALTRAVSRRDAAFILRIATDDIRYSFGDSGSRAGFAEYWGLNRPATSRLWAELGEALRLGCTYDEGLNVVMPAMNQVGDEDMDTDYQALLVAVRPGAALRAGPSDRSRILARLRWNVVTLEDRDGHRAWERARLADGRRGYIRRSLFRGFSDSSAYFVKQGGRWRMAAFIAGD